MRLEVKIGLAVEIDGSTAEEKTYSMQGQAGFAI